MTLLLKTFSLYIINRKIHGCLEIRNLFLVLKMISHSFDALTREISAIFTRNKFRISAHPCIILYILKSGYSPFCACVLRFFITCDVVAPKL